MYLGFAGHQPPSLLEMFGSLRESLVRLFHALPHNLPSSSNQHIQSAINYMSAHIGENPKLAHVAEEIHINPSYLSRLFQKEFNQTFTDICNEMAIRHAMGLISGGVKISEAAQAAGFSSEKYFSTVFKKFVGITPKEYQKKGY